MSVTLVNPFVTGIGGGTPNPGDANLYGVTVTVASGTVSDDLTAFPVMVRLSDMPAGFWAHVKADGGDIRVALGVDLIPCDLARFDYTDQDGVLFVRRSLLTASDTEFQIRYGNAALTLLDYDDANGRDAVWADYEAVYLLGETSHNRTGGARLRIAGDPDLFERVATSPDINGHQGVTTDGTFFYVFDEQAIRKYNLSWTLVATNSSIASGVGNPGITGLGGGTVANGKLYSASSTATGQHLAVWSASDLSFIEAFNVSAFASAAADYTYRPETGLLYTIRFGVGTAIIAIDPDDGTNQGSITLSVPLVSAQGITWWRGAFWVAYDGSPDETNRVELDGTVTDSGMYGSRGVSTAWEGLEGYGDRIYQLDDPGGTEVVYTYKPFDVDLSAGGGADFWANARVVGDLTSAGVLGTEWTMGCTLVSADGVQRAPMALASTSGSANRVLIANMGGTDLAVWDDTNGILSVDPPVNPTPGTAYRMNAVYDGTTARHVYLNGGSKATDATITAKGATLSRLVVGSGLPETQDNSWRGKVGFGYCRAGVLSDDWIAAEYDNLSAPETFSTLGAEEDL